MCTGILVWLLTWQYGLARTPEIQHALNPGWPSRSAPQAAEPLGTPHPVRKPSGSYTFARTEGGMVGFDPCRPLHYVMRTMNMPSAGPQLVTQAMARLSKATGLKIVYDGPTDEAPRSDRPPLLKDLYGDRWAPVLIAWSDPEEFPTLAGDIAGLGGGVSVQAGSNPAIYVSGSLTLDAPQITGMLEMDRGQELARAVLLHELAHVVGLGHVDDPAQLMSPTLTSKVTEYAAGDLTGLAALGRGPCVPGV